MARAAGAYTKPVTGLKIAHVGTYPPRQCGIATYTQDVVSAVHSNTPAAPPVVVAMAAPGEQIRYGWPVRYVIRQDEPSDYVAVARALINEGVEMVSIQHEHGIFGGAAGDLLAAFLAALGGKIPVVTTLHTVLPHPTNAVRHALRVTAERSNRIIVLNSRAISLLRTAYGIATDSVSAIPHGTPTVDQDRRVLVRANLELEKRVVLSTFGLIGPGKGLEHAITALARIAGRRPDLHYYILGATHPGIVRESGEAYREGLCHLAGDLGVADRIHFENRYLTLDELTDWLLATDIYVTPYLNPDQIVSGTLSYAVAAGKPVVSTPYLHAQELLAEGRRGILTPFSDPEALAANLDALLGDPGRCAAMAASARAFGRESAWPCVARRYYEVFCSAAAVPNEAAKPARLTPARAIKNKETPRGRRS
jgi:glycosyltransferase involved in cell wall biosynthesis